MKQYLDCYAQWTDKAITFGNDCIEMFLSIADNLPITEYVFD